MSFKRIYAEAIMIHRYREEGLLFDRSETSRGWCWKPTIFVHYFQRRLVEPPLLSNGENLDNLDIDSIMKAVCRNLYFKQPVDMRSILIETNPFAFVDPDPPYESDE